jgi:hypothetical protein
MTSNIAGSLEQETSTATDQHNRIPVEVEKDAEERGSYIHPEDHGQPKEKGLRAAGASNRWAQGARA